MARGQSAARHWRSMGGGALAQISRRSYDKAMKVAKKSPGRRRTLTLPLAAFPILDRLRGETSRSAYVGGLLEREHDRVEEERFYAEVNAAYTAEVCKETLQVNEEFPIHEE